MRLLVLTVIVGSGAWAQPAPPPLRLTLPAAEVQAAFLARLEIWSRYVDPQKVTTPYRTAPAARPTEFGLSPAELVPLAAIARSFRASFDQVSADLLALRAASGDVTEVLARRQQAIDTAMTQVRTVLPADVWKRLNAYLEQNSAVVVGQ